MKKNLLGENVTCMNDITLGELRAWAEDKQLVVTRVSMKVKQPWVVARMIGSETVRLITKASSEKLALWRAWLEIN
jgi:hypothetical protein